MITIRGFTNTNRIFYRKTQEVSQGIRLTTIECTHIILFDVAEQHGLEIVEYFFLGAGLSSNA